MLLTLLKELVEHIQHINISDMEKAIMLIANTPGKLLIIGNGGSNAIASHMAEDYSNNYKPTLCFSDTAFMSCFANDYGWEQAFLKWLKLFAVAKQDTLILISSSGASRNIIHCAQWAKENEFPLITLSGFKSGNPLRQMGNVNFWVNSTSYKDVEITHLVILHTMLEALIAKK